MDFIAHGLWTNAAYEGVAQAKKKKRSLKDIVLATFFGMAPDFFSLGIFAIVNLFTTGTLWPYAQARFKDEWGKEIALVSTNWMSGVPSVSDAAFLVPPYMNILYGITHSFLLFAVAFLIIWLVRKRPYWLFAGWGFHILLDSFSHSDKFFPTPILFPISDFHIDGVSWADPIFMIVNYTLIVAVYLWLYKFRRRGKIKYNSKDVKT